MENNNFRMGLRDGMPIGLGYVAVSFAFGLFATVSGLKPWQALLISMLNLTSAGQMAAIPCLSGAGGLAELALTQALINSRYALMSVSYSQRMSRSVGIRDRLLAAFANTDEIFAMVMAKGQILGGRYIRGLVIPPYIGWAVGTLTGAVAGSILPPMLVTALSMSMYAMFIAIIVPAAVKSLATLAAILLAIGASCAFAFIPAFRAVPSGFVIIICAVVASVIFALVAPVKNEEVPEDEH
jgi:predicted branched-subunit amino acid permease